MEVTLLSLFTVTATVPRLRVARSSKVASLPTGEAQRGLTTWIRKKSWSFISRQILGQRSLESLLDFLGYGHLFFIPYQFEKQRLKRRIKNRGRVCRRTMLNLDALSSDLSLATSTNCSRAARSACGSKIPDGRAKC